MSFIVALMNATQLGMEPNTPLAQAVREFDSFEYQYGLDSRLVHRPGDGVRSPTSMACLN